MVYDIMLPAVLAVFSGIFFQSGCEMVHHTECLREGPLLWDSHHMNMQ